MRGMLIFYLTQHFLFDDDAGAGPVRRLHLARLPAAADRRLPGRPLSRHAQGDRLRRAAAGRRPLHDGDREAPATQDADLSRARPTTSTPKAGRTTRQALHRRRRPALRVRPSADGGLEIKGLPPARRCRPFCPTGAYAARRHRRAPAASASSCRHLLSRARAHHHGRRLPEGEHLHHRRPALPARTIRAAIAGFTLYYYGINLGAFWAAILCGWLGAEFGWWCGLRPGRHRHAARLLVFTRRLLFFGQAAAAARQGRAAESAKLLQEAAASARSTASG